MNEGSVPYLWDQYQYQPHTMRKYLIVIFISSLQLSDGSVKLFENDQELQEYEASKVNLNLYKQNSIPHIDSFVKDVRLSYGSRTKTVGAKIDSIKFISEATL